MNAARWFLSYIGVQLLCLVVWFVGPLWAPLEPTLPRIGAIAGLAVLWVIGNLLLDLRRMSRDRSLAAGVAGGKPADGEAAQLQEKLSAAMATLRKARGKRGALYEQPWYVIIGPPGAGKTTALLNAGLEFPLADQVGRGALAGVGGTRLCEWWFTDRAVMIDTAGRYTTQDSDAQSDKAGWDAFLGLLKRTRPKQPLNGVIVAIALADVVGDTGGADRLLHARAIRRRIVELEEKLGIRIPVYALLTKSDLLSGFNEFFGDLDREAREQVWGVTFPLPKRRGAVLDALAGFGAEFKRWTQVLEQRMYARLQSEPSLERRVLVSAFPGQFATVGAPLGEFLGEAFSPREKGRTPWLRGVYFTSATQEGTPFDRMAGTIARAFGLPPSQARWRRGEEGRTFFLAGLLRDVIFREAMLGSASPGSRRRAALGRLAGFLLCALVAAGGGFYLWQQQGRAAEDIERVRTALAGYGSTASALALDPVQDADLPGLLPLLDQARALPFANTPPDANPADPFDFTQQGKLAAAARAVYRHGLEYALLPRLLWRLETQLRGNLSDPDYEYGATRVYLMLGAQGPMDRALVQQWMAADWAQSYPPELQQDLAAHLAALLANPLPPSSLDGAVVEAARATFNRVSLAARIYSRVKLSAAAAQLAPWRLSDVLGALGVTVFIRVSGRPMTEPVAGLFTPEGFRTALLPGLGPAIQDVASESWVLGSKTELQPDSPAARDAEQQVLQLYAGEYQQTWDALLADLDVAPLRSLAQSAQDLFVLASREHSPMRGLLEAVGRNTALPASGAAPIAAVSAHFQPIRDALQPGAFEQTLKPLSDLQQQLAKMFQSANRAGATPDPGSADPVVALQTEALRQPPPLSRWLQSIAASGRALRGGGVKEQITAAFKAGGGVGALCPQVVGGKYPFTPDTDKDAALDEFGRLFGAGGVMDAFFNTQLKPYVDTTGKVWKFQQVEGLTPPFAPADLQQFQRAQALRDLFFAGGGAAPKLRFDLTALSADPAGAQATLDTGSASVQTGGGAPRPVQVTWPGPNAPAASLTWVASGGAAGGGTTLKETGPWALLRLLARGTAAPAGPDRWTVTFKDGERTARFELRGPGAAVLARPFADFRCPTLQ